MDLKILLLICISIVHRIGFGQESTIKSDIAYQDYQSLVASIKENHIDPFWLRSESDFDGFTKTLGDEIKAQKEIDTDFFDVCLLKTLAFIGDGHSSFVERSKKLGYSSYSVDWFDEDLVIVRVDSSRREILGAKVIAINNVPISEVSKKIKKVVPHSNKSGFKLFSPLYFKMPGVLHGLGIGDSRAETTLTLQLNDSKTKEQVFEEISFEKYQELPIVHLSRQNEKALPLYRQNSDQNYWFTHLTEENVIYVSYNRVDEIKGDRLNDFTKRLSLEIRDKQPNKVIFDLRNNGGGNNFLNAYFLRVVYENEFINHPDRLFVITSSETFSAALNFVGDMERLTSATLVGTPPGDYVNHPGDSETFTLSYSNWRYNLSQLFWINTFEMDKRSEFEMDIPVSNSLDNYLENEDRILEAILNHNQSSKKTVHKIPNQLIGSFSYHGFRSVQFDHDAEGSRISIDHYVRGYIKPLGEGTYTSPIRGTIFKFSEDALRMISDDGQEIELEREQNQNSAMQELLIGDTKLARAKFIELKKNQPLNKELAGNNLARYAFQLAVVQNDIKKSKELLKIVKVIDPDSKIAKEVLLFQRLFKGRLK